MANPSKQKGTRAETRVVKFLAEYGIQSKRKPLHGSSDEGDIDVVASGFGGSGIVLEVKAGKQTLNPSRNKLDEWFRQTKVEGVNSKKPSALCVVRYNRALKNADVYFKWQGFRVHMFLDEFCEFIKSGYMLFAK